MSDEDKVQEGVEAAQEAVRKADTAVQKVNARGLANVLTDAGSGFLALSVTIYAANIALNKFRAVYKGRGGVVSS